MSQTLLNEILNTVEDCIRKIKPGERLKYDVPLNFLSSPNCPYNCWDIIQSIGDNKSDEIFVTIRFPDHDWYIKHKVMVDFYRPHE